MRSRIIFSIASSFSIKYSLVSKHKMKNSYFQLEFLSEGVVRTFSKEHNFIVQTEENFKDSFF